MRHKTLCKKWLPGGNTIDRRNGQLDSLRALSVTGVLIGHFWPTCILNFVDLGHVGVRLFFVLSGYLITGILLRFRSSIEARRSDAATALRRFYIRRFLRIFPPYYALLALMVVTKLPGVRDTLWWHAGYASNFLFALHGSWTPWVTSHFWSLAVEEQFYLVWPFLILLVPRSRLVAVVIAIIVSSPLFRLIALFAGANDVALYVATPGSLDALGLGSLLALCADQPVAWRRLTRLGLISIPITLITLGVLLVNDQPWLNYLVYETGVALALACLVGKTAKGFGGLPGRLLSLRPLQYVGKISYGIYLYHVFVLAAFWKLLGVAHLPLLDKGPVLLLIATSMTVAMAALSWKFLEQPFNRLKRHFPYEPEARGRTREVLTQTVKIIDLGLAKGVTEDTLSIAGSFIGTPAYASPEQFAGLGTDIRSDLYSLGVTLWEMLSGKPPFHGSAAELMDQHQHTAPPFEKLGDIPGPIIVLLNVLLAKDPSQRFQTPAQLQNAVARVREAIASESGLTADELRSADGRPTENLPKGKPVRRPVRWLMGAAVCLAVLLITWFFYTRYFGLFNKLAPTEKSIAVLPFENISPNKDDAYFADGVQDEILNNLAKIAQLKVISRTSVMQYRGETKRDLRQIAAALGVANVLEGTVRRDGNHVRVSTDLIDAHTDNTIWADSYDRDLIDIFAIQSEIAERVALKLSARLSPEEEKSIAEKPTDNLEAYDLYLQAKQLVEANYWALVSSEKEIYPKIISLLEQATQKDSKFALAYCLIAKAHDTLYVDDIDHTPERRALGDAAVNEALRLRPDLPEVHLAVAWHLYIAYRDFAKARVQIAVAAKALSNNSYLLELRALIDRVQGRWEECVTGLERAVVLDPRNPDPLVNLGLTYGWLRRYRDSDRVWNRLIELDPNQRTFRLSKVGSAFAETADLGVRAVDEALPPSMKGDPAVAYYRVYYSICARDFAAAEEILSESPNKEIYFLQLPVGVLVPRYICTLWVDFLRGNHPTIEQFGSAREQLLRKLEADPTNPSFVMAMACADLALGHKQESIQEAQRAMKMRPISEDAVEGPAIASDAAEIYALAGRPDDAFEQLKMLTNMPGERLNYGDLKTNPAWDPLRKDPRFDKLLAELAPHD